MGIMARATRDKEDRHKIKGVVGLIKGACVLGGILPLRTGI
jgi:hypothetical protein